MKFNPKLLLGTQILDSTFPLSSRKIGENGGRVGLKIASEAALATANAPGGSSSTGALSDSSGDEAEGPKQPAEKPSLKLSSKWNSQDSKLKTSAFVIVEEDVHQHPQSDPVLPPAPSPPSGGVDSGDGLAPAHNTPPMR